MTKTHHQTVIGVMGGGSSDGKTEENARELGKLIAQNGWVLLNGGRAAGVMDASAQGAKEAGGLVVGVVPDDHPGQASPYLDVVIQTGMGSARNSINVLSSTVVVACRGGMGTISEIALAVKSNRPVVLLDFDPGETVKALAPEGRLVSAADPAEAIKKIKGFLASDS